MLLNEFSLHGISKVPVLLLFLTVPCNTGSNQFNVVPLLPKWPECSPFVQGGAAWCSDSGQVRNTVSLDSTSLRCETGNTLQSGVLLKTHFKDDLGTLEQMLRPRCERDCVGLLCPPAHVDVSWLLSEDGAPNSHVISPFGNIKIISIAKCLHFVTAEPEPAGRPTTVSSCLHSWWWSSVVWTSTTWHVLLCRESW